MAIIAAQDGTMYDLTPEQADQYYSIKDFRQGQEFLKSTKLANATPGPTPVPTMSPPGTAPPPTGIAAGSGPAYGYGGGVPSGLHGNIPNPYSDLINAAADKYGIPRGLHTQLIRAESNFDPNIVNKKSGATGLGQFMPGTAKDMGVTDRTDPAQSIEGSAKYLAQLYKQFGSWSKAISAYNMGPGGAQKNNFSMAGYSTYGAGRDLIAAADAADKGGSIQVSSGAPSEGYGPSQRSDVRGLDESGGGSGATNPLQELNAKQILALALAGANRQLKMTPIEYDPWKVFTPARPAALPQNVVAGGPWIAGRPEIPHAGGLSNLLMQRVGGW